MHKSPLLPRAQTRRRKDKLRNLGPTAALAGLAFLGVAATRNAPPLQKYATVSLLFLEYTVFNHQTTTSPNPY